jgi:hypothetical protein
MAFDDDRPTTTQRYPTLVAFYRADPVRLESRERDIGLWWRTGAEGPMHRAAWVQDTGELYLVRLGPVAEGGGAVEVMARVADPERLEGALRGWRERCGMPGSLQWLRMRVARIGRAGSLASRLAPGVTRAMLV